MVLQYTYTHMHFNRLLFERELSVKFIRKQWCMLIVSVIIEGLIHMVTSETKTKLTRICQKIRRNNRKLSRSTILPFEVLS